MHLRFRTASGKEDELVAFLKHAVPVYESLPGVRVRLLQHLGDRSRFIEFIEYSTASAFDRDQQRIDADPRMRSLLDSWRGLLEHPAEVETYQDISERIR